jgi:hypothetical protein
VPERHSSGQQAFPSLICRFCWLAREDRARQLCLYLIERVAAEGDDAVAVLDGSLVTCEFVRFVCKHRHWRSILAIAPSRVYQMVFLRPNHGGHTVANPISKAWGFSWLMSHSLLPDIQAERAARLHPVATAGDLEGAERHLTATAKQVG